jgi:hypothetical protein
MLWIWWIRGQNSLNCTYEYSIYSIQDSFEKFEKFNFNCQPYCPPWCRKSPWKRATGEIVMNIRSRKSISLGFERFAKREKAWKSENPQRVWREIRMGYSITLAQKRAIQSWEQKCNRESQRHLWRVILTFFQKTFFGTTFSPLSLIKPCELLRTSGLIINKDLIGNTKSII